MLRFGVVFVSLVAALGACVRDLPGQNPPAAARLYFPGHMALVPDANTLLIVNTNFDQRFNVGWVTQVDLIQLLGQVSTAAAAGSILDTPGAATSLRQGVRIPSLGGDIVVDGTNRRAYVAHRGQGLVAVLDFVAAAGQPLTLGCGTRTEDADLTHVERETDCARQNLIDLRQDPGPGVRAKVGPEQATLFADPAALALVPGSGNYPILAVGYLGSSWLTLLSTGPTAADTTMLRSRPVGQGALGRLLAIPEAAITAASGTLLGATHYASDHGDRGALYSVDLGRMLGVSADDAFGVDRFDLGLPVGARQSPADISGAVFSPIDPAKVYVVQAGTDAVTIILRSEVPASTQHPDGTTTYTPRLQTQVRYTAPINDARPSQIAYVQRGAGRSDLLAVSSLAKDAIYFFNPSNDALELVGKFALRRGQGPFDVMHIAADGKDYLFVTTFFDHGLTVLDISSPEPREFRLAASIHDDLFPIAASQP